MSVRHRMPYFRALALVFSLMSATANSQEVRTGYSMPSSFPYYSAPPVQFRDSQIVTITFKTTPEVVRWLVPEPLLPNPDNVMFIYIGSLNIDTPSAGRFNYIEAGIGVPVVFSKTKGQGQYAVCLYLNKAAPIVGGREVWGWPKKDAEMTFTDAEGAISARVERLGTILLNVNGKRRQKIDPSLNQPQMPWFLQKIIPAAQKNAPPDVWQLVSVNVNNVTKELWDCTATLEMQSGPQDPVGRIKILEIVNAQFSVSDFVLDYGRILYDYLGKRGLPLK